MNILLEQNEIPEDLLKYFEPVSENEMQDVWKIATQPYSGAHYATYPEALVERCIRAGTSERGCCPKCGGQWERVIEKERPPKNVFTDTTNPQDGIVNGGGAWNGGGKGAGQKLQNWLNEHPPITIGFRPSCACGCDTTTPATILDPFAGSGTTCLVAKRMGRSAIGLDLSYQYLRENAWQRVQMNAPVLL